MIFRLTLFLSLLAILITACAGAPAEPPVQAAQTNPDTSVTLAPPAQADPTEAEAQQVAQNTPPEGVVATVNGEPITEAEFNELLERRSRELNDPDDEAVQNFILTALINQKLTRQAAERMEITVTQEEVDAEINQLKAIAENNDATWQAWLQQNGYTEEVLRNELELALLVKKVRDEIVGDAGEQTTRQVHARHILVETEAEALNVRQRLMNGESFVDLAAQYSKDITTRNEGGDLGWFAEGELLEPFVSDVAFNQAAGDVSQPVATRLGFHIIETLGFDDLPLQPEKRAQVEQNIFDEWMRTQTDSAIIEIYR